MNKIKNIGKWMFFIALAVSVLFISGCSSYGGGSLFNAHTGSEALRVSFMDNAPPDTVYSNTAFTVGILLENYGAYGIDAGTLVIGTDNFESGKMLQGSDNVPFTLQGRVDTRTFIGDRQAKFFLMKAPDIGSENEQEATINIKTCYKYTTTAQASVCIDKSMYNAAGKSACTFKNKISLSSQGAPVVVNEIDIAKIFESDTTVKFTFTIHISNYGTGFVVNSSQTSKFCSGKDSLSSNSFGRATVSSAALGTELLDCSPRNYADLSQNKEDVVTCTSGTMDVSNSAYVTSLKINVTYGYVNTDSTTIRILRLNS